MKIIPFCAIFTLFLLTTAVKADADNNAPIIAAVTDSKCEKVKDLLENGELPDTKFTDILSKQDIPILFMSISRGDTCIVNALVSSGADINYLFKFKSGDPIWVREKTPLLVAIQVAYRSKNLDIINILLRNGANTDLKASDGVTFVEHGFNLLKMNRSLTESDADKLIQDIKSLMGK